MSLAKAVIVAGAVIDCTGVGDFQFVPCECPLAEDNAVVGLNFTWLAAQHVLVLAAGATALSLNVLKPLCCSDRKMTQRLQ